LFKKWLDTKADSSHVELYYISAVIDNFDVNAKILCYHFHSSDLTTLMLLVVRQQEHLAVPKFLVGSYFSVPLSPSSIIWYQPMGFDALRLGR